MIKTILTAFFTLYTCVALGAAVIWPVAPTDGDTFTAGNGVTYYYNGTYEAWQSVSELETMPDMQSASFYDNTPAVVIGTTQVVINIDTTAENNAPAIFSLASDEVTVGESGMYLVTYSVVSELATGTRDTLHTYLMTDSSGSFVKIPGMQSGVYGRIANEIQGSSNTTVVTLAAGDKIRIEAVCTLAAACRTKGGGTHISIIKLQGIKGDRGLPATAKETVRLLPNPRFEVVQEGTSFVSPSSGSHILDTYEHGSSGGSAYTVTQSTDTPTVAQAGKLIEHSIKWDVTTAEVVIASEYDRMYGFIEGYDWQKIAQQDFTIGFWHKYTKTGTYSVAFRNSGFDYYYIDTYVQDVSDTWEYAELNIAASPSAGTWDYANGAGLRIGWSFMCGSDYYGTEDAWTSGNEGCVSGDANGADSTANNLLIADITIESDTVRSGYDNYQAELAHVQRYYEAGWFRDTSGVPSTSFTTAGYYSWVTFNVEKRIVPSLTVVSDHGTSANDTIRTTGSSMGRSNVVAQRGNSGTYEADARF